METKLTLRLEKNLIKEAKNFAKSRNVSLSGLVSDYFKLISIPQEKIEKSPVLSEISGILQPDKATDQLSSEYRKRIEDKYLGR